MESVLMKKIEFAIEDFLLDEDFEYENLMGSLFAVTVETGTVVKNTVMTINIIPIGFIIHIVPLDETINKEKINELRDFINRVNVTLRFGHKFICNEEADSIIFTHYVDCIDKNEKGPSREKVAWNIMGALAEYRNYIDGVMMVNYGIGTPEEVFEGIRSGE